MGTLGTAYVRGLQGAGVHATLKHFVGYSASRAGRNHAPVHAGPRELADVLLPRSRWLSWTAGAFRHELLRGDRRRARRGGPCAAHRTAARAVGFDGVVVADYFAVAFLEVLHGVAADRGDAAVQALVAGIDVELPTGDAYLEPLAAAVRAGDLDESYVDRAVLRVLAQKEDLGLLDPGAFEGEPPSAIDLDSPHHRDVARRVAEESLVLLSNDGSLPLAGPGRPAPPGSP
ncbi:glycoside hydrolase family 3 N-terminal domain-containing protein [Oerskovia sp. M15]